MSDFQHDYAIFFESGVEDRIYVEELSEKYAQAVSLSHDGNLIDPVTGRNLKVQAAVLDGRKVVRRACFAFADGNVGKTLSAYPTDRSEEHTLRIAEILYNLRRFRTVEFHGEDGLVACCRHYEWTMETHRILSQRGSIRHDVFGARPGNSMSANAPSVAIEVVDSSWPCQNSWEDMVEWTGRTPSLVVFDHARSGGFLMSPRGPDEKDKWLKVSAIKDSVGKQSTPAQLCAAARRMKPTEDRLVIRSICLVTDGVVCLPRKNSCSAADLRSADVFRNEVHGCLKDQSNLYSRYIRQSLRSSS